jgi:hypothetical protein
MPTLFHTSHPGLCAALRRDPHWTQVSAMLHGDNKLGRSIERPQERMRAAGLRRSLPRGAGVSLLGVEA